MDNSFEQSVRKPDYTADKTRLSIYRIFMGISIVGCVIGLILAFTGSYLLGIGETAVCGILIIVFWRLADGAVIEYDYEFTDGALRFARISNSAKRKELYSIPLNEIESIAPYNGDADNRKVFDVTLNADARKYAVRCTVKGDAAVVIWEPKQELLKLIRQERPSLVTL